jgi:hypothetical protein
VTLQELDADNSVYELPGGPIISLTPGLEAGEVMALVASAVDADPPVLAALDTTADGLALTEVGETDTRGLQAIAL